jgi:dienelactone hydrolase
MGVVYRARDIRLERDVALKALSPEIVRDTPAQTRFHREALALAKLSHPNIATLYDVGQSEGVSYLVMECVEGQSLAQKLSTGKLAVRESLVLGIDIASALEAAHEYGIVHRDLKPANVIVTPKGHAKVLDFGVAKLLRPIGADSASTSDTIGAVGTLLYMSPEQAVGHQVDTRSDIWSLGVLLYECLTGVTPFRSSAVTNVLHEITTGQQSSIRDHGVDGPRILEETISRALSKKASSRYQSAGEMRRDLAAALAQVDGVQSHAERASYRRMVLRAAAIAVVIVGTAAFLGFRRYENRLWARTGAVPEVLRMQSHDSALAASLVLQRAMKILPADSQLDQVARASSRVVNVTTTPAGASVYLADYADTSGNWRSIGTTPLTDVTIPTGYFRWRFVLPDRREITQAPVVGKRLKMQLDSALSAPPGMVYAPGWTWINMISFVGWVGPYKLPPFYIDRFEVTNREYQRFVDAGGYERSEYWTERFADGGSDITWHEAMEKLRDSTGRPGPSTWKGGHFAAGEDNYPVAGVSWYEAAAYAKWSHKSLPALAQWYYAAPPEMARYAVKVSNISHNRLAPVGWFKGVGPFGTYDMAGNVKEWVANPLTAHRRFLLGGAWSSESYLYSEPEALSAFDRSSTNGFRCVVNLQPVPVGALAEITPLERDFRAYKPASDDVFAAYRAIYSYDRAPLDSTTETVSDNADWRKERVTFRTAYGNERMAAYLYLPKHVHPPYETVVFSPSARVLELSDSRMLGDTSFFDYVVQSGRAVLYPIYQGTYERRGRAVLPGSSEGMTLLVQRYKDLARSLDYLATRSDIDTARIAFLGVSMGSAEGVIYTTLLQDRLKTDILLDGGFFLGPHRPGSDQADFAPRLAIPVLMLNGRYDFSFALERSQTPLFEMLGTPRDKKRHVVLDTPHDVRNSRAEMMSVVLKWLDQYPGPVH